MATVTIRGGTRWRDTILERYGAKFRLRAGVLEGATNGEGEPVAEYAAYNEYGAARIPARPFLRQTLSEQGSAWIAGLGRLLVGGRDTRSAAQLVGRRMVEDIQAKIMSNMPPPNSPDTVLRKNSKEAGRAGTLVDTGALVESINYEIADGLV